MATTQELTDLQKREQTSLTRSTQQRRLTAPQQALAKLTPKSFLMVYNASVGARLMAQGATSGELALRDELATLGDVVQVLGVAAATEWLVMQLFRLEEAGAVTLSTDAADANRLRRETAQMIITRHIDYKVAELSLFFARFLAADYNEVTAGNFGATSVYTALRAYDVARQADVRRVERVMETQGYMRRLDEMRSKACSYEEYKKKGG